MAKKKGKPAEIEEEIEYVSRTELKREAQEFHQLGSEIAKMGKKQRERLPLNDDLKEAMVVADKISNKSDAYRRHLNYIAKTLRTVENIEDIKAIIKLDRLNSTESKLSNNSFGFPQLIHRAIYRCEENPHSSAVLSNTISSTSL